MRTLVIVKVEVILQCREQIGAGGELAGVDRDSALFQWGQEVRRGELRALIGVPDFRLAEATPFIEGFYSVTGDSLDEFGFRSTRSALQGTRLRRDY